MLSAFRRFRYRRRVLQCLAVLMYPAKRSAIAGSARHEIARYISLGQERSWSPETVAAIVAAIYVSNMIRSLDVRGRARLVDQMRAGPADLAAELVWMSNLKNVDPKMDPLDFRLNFINGMLASWLVRDKSFDMFTKAIFATMTAQAAAEVNSVEIGETFDGLIVRIGTAT